MPGSEHTKMEPLPLPDSHTTRLPLPSPTQVGFIFMPIGRLRKLRPKEIKYQPKAAEAAKEKSIPRSQLIRTHIL